MADLNELRKMVKDAIESGANDLEQIHKFIANLPMEYLEKVGPLEDTAKDVKEFQEKTIGNVYSFIRKVNNKVDEIAADLLEDDKSKA